MPIDKVSAAQFADQIKAGISNRDKTLDVTTGPIPDGAIFPQAAVLENQNDRARKLSLLLSLANADEFAGFETDLDGIVFNEGETRNAGAQSTTTALFSRASAPTTDAPVQRGYPVGSQPDESSGATVTFVTSEARTLPAAFASAYFNLVTQRYELSVPVVSVVDGSASRVGANRINRPLRPLAFFDSVTNPTAAAGGRDRETNAELIARYLISIIGRQTGVANGIVRAARSDFADVAGIKVVHGNNPLLTRAATDAGAVDAWVKGEALLQQGPENHTYLGVGQLIAVNVAPLVAVVTVTSGANTYIEGVDYEVVTDSSGIGRSTREAAGVRFLPTATTPLPAVGDVVSLTYTYNNLIRALQTGFETDDTLELGRDLLFRRGIETPIVLVARLRVTAGFNATQILTAVQTAVLSFVNALNLGEDVENSDIQGVVRAISGVDNFIIDRLTLATVLSGTSDIPIEDNAFPTLSTANLSVGLI